MKKSLPLLFAVLLLLTGCPYESPVLPADLKEPVKADFTGKWICSDKGYNLDSVQIEKKNESTFRIYAWYKQQKKEHRQPIVLDAWHIALMGKTFICLPYNNKIRTAYLLYSLELREENPTKVAIAKKIPEAWFDVKRFSAPIELRQEYK